MFGRGSTPLFEPQECGQYEPAIKQDRSGIRLDRKHDLAGNRAAGGSVVPEMPNEVRESAIGAAQTPNEVPESAMVRLKRQMKSGSRQWCGSNAR